MKRFLDSTNEEQHYCARILPFFIPIYTGIITRTKIIISIEYISKNIYSNCILRKLGNRVCNIIYNACIRNAGHNKRNIARMLIFFF